MAQNKNWIKFQGETYEVKPGERALDAMLRRGAPVTFSCRKGACRSCMMQTTAGDPGKAAKERLPKELQDHGFFLPCLANDMTEVEAKLPDLSLCTQNAVVFEKNWITDNIIQLRLELEVATPWAPGQWIALMNENGATRNYSIVSMATDFYMDLHIKVYEGGALSGWVAQSLNVGDSVKFQGPGGHFTYRDELKNTPLVLVGTGTGGGALMGIVHDALARGHDAPIQFYHGAKTNADLHLREMLKDIDPERVKITQIASREEVENIVPTRVADIALLENPDLTGTAVFVCGSPDMVEGVRIQALRQGAPLEHLYSDAFEPAAPFMPDEDTKFKNLQADPELWEALENGKKLTRILTDFYTKAYMDPRLAPFFHRTTLQRAIDKQYNFLQDMFSGSKLYFGEKPFNAHHWMVISDELFDYRERLIMKVAREHGVPEHLLGRWAAVHELFRREIVKPAARGMIQHGIERYLEGYSEETMEVGTVCDGCVSEVFEGDKVRMHMRTGEIFCMDCEGKTIQGVDAA